MRLKTRYIEQGGQTPYGLMCKSKGRNTTQEKRAAGFASKLDSKEESRDKAKAETKKAFEKFRNDFG